MLKVVTHRSTSRREDAFRNGVTYDAKPFEYRAWRRSDRTLRYTQGVVELNTLIDALSAAKISPTEIKTLRPNGRRATPDFELLIDGSRTYVECTAAGDPQSFSWQLNVGDWDSSLSVYLNDHPELLGRLGKHYAALIPSRLPSNREIPQLVTESVAFLADEDLDSYAGAYGKRVPQKYSRLAGLDTIIAVGNSNTPHAFVQMPAMSTGGPNEAIHDLLVSFRRKADRGYEGFRPIWLIVAASQIAWKLDDAVSQFVKVVQSIRPFERLFVATSNESFEITET